ncbi:MAG: YdaU family protein [Thalassospira sp.]|uniref:YdaU family protein n=1 Tax=Thalassospira sp. TaxID=1912094 RepID=UPI003A84E885
MSKFNAARSRANRPCPLWIDAFHRKTQHLQTDEIGAYMLIIMAMWSQEDCSLPDDDARLARVAKVSTRLWNSRIGPAIRPFLTSENGVVFIKRLREEAGYVERQVKQQSDRKKGKKSDKPLENNETDISTDNTTDQSWEHPSQQPNSPTEIDNNKLSSISDAQARDDDEIWIESEGRDYLIATGSTETQAPRLINEWLKAYPADQVRGAIAQAQIAAASSPPAYVAKVLRNGARSNLTQFPVDREKTRKDAEEAEKADFRKRLAASRGEEVENVN